MAKSTELPHASPPLGPAALQGNTAFATSIALFLLRLALGWTFIYHGAAKLFGIWGGPEVHVFANYLHLPLLPPLVWAYMAACGEFVGGISVLLGLLARLGAIPIIISMSVAIATVHGPYGFSHNSPPGYEFNVNLIAIALAVIIMGPGLISVDALIFRRGLWARGPQPLSTPGERRM